MCRAMVTLQLCALSSRAGHHAEALEEVRQKMVQKPDGKKKNMTKKWFLNIPTMLVFLKKINLFCSCLFWYITIDSLQ